MRVLCPFIVIAVALSARGNAEIPPAAFRAQTLDAELGIGYGLSVADIDGDGKLDIVLVDAKETVWYRNPEWTKHRMTGHLTRRDHVCVAACDIDDDNKAEVAVGAEWNPGDTKNSGAVFTLTAPGDPTKEWTAQKQHHEPTVHRMHWVNDASGCYLAVLPLHGCDNVNAEGDGILFLGYEPAADPAAKWSTFLLNDSFHLAHNFDVVSWTKGAGDSMLVASKEGVSLVRGREGKGTLRLTTKGAGEVRLGELEEGRRFIAAVEPFHGNSVVVYPSPAEGQAWDSGRVVVDDSLAEGHALACADLLGLGYDQVVAGWRKPNAEKKVGIRLYVPDSHDGTSWKRHAVIDDNTMACEDLKVADLNSDGKPDIIAAGRATRNLVVYWNERD
ncbi:VCBS repeat-containing protein [Haloferula helveola]